MISREERARLLEGVATVIVDDFYGDFHTILSETYAVTGFTPDQANNEIRNILLHLAQVCRAEEVAVAEHNLEQARWHIDLAKRDCFKICILDRCEKIAVLIDVVELKFGTIRASDRRRFNSIKQTLQQLIRQDKQEEGNQELRLASAYEASYREICELEEHICATYTPASITKLRAFFARSRRIFVHVGNRLGLIVLSAVVIALLSSPWLPAWVRAPIDNTFLYAACRMSSHPLCTELRRPTSPAQ
jgi:hypothetical protein